MKIGLLLINLGTPQTPSFMHVWRYLREFLFDNRVVNLPAPLRFLLLYGVILPFRVSKARRGYQAIWTSQGSPLRCHSETLEQKLQQLLGESYQVMVAMRYGQPSIDQALDKLKHCDQLLILPLYPQYSSAASGSALQAVLQRIAKRTFIPSIRVVREFYQHPMFIRAQAQRILPYLTGLDKLIFSYHGLPETQIQQSGCQVPCTSDCVLEPQTLLHTNCYRAQCYQTSVLLAQALQLQAHQYVTVFQSRVGRTPWIQPYLEEHLVQLAGQGIKRIAIACPSFVTDCLETLEEIGIRMRALWHASGGEHMTLIPCLNGDDNWCEAIMSFFLINPTNE